MLHPVGTERAVSGDLRHTVRVLPQDQGAGAVALRNIRNACFHIGHDLVTGSHKGLGLARFAKDILQQFQPLLIALQRVSLGGSTHGGKADRGNTAGLQGLCVGGIACIVQDDIRVQLHDLLNVEVTLRIDRVAGFHQLRGDVLEHGVGNDRLEGAAIAHDIGCAALKIGHVGGQDGDLVDDHTSDLVGDFDLIAAVVDDGVGAGLIGRSRRRDCFAGNRGRFRSGSGRSCIAGTTTGGQDTGSADSSHSSEKRTTCNLFHGKLLKMMKISGS